ncbi:MAG: decaprenyl-phosphate phosphoribosyltransferase [Dysgonamonadaceae bacterium]|jgi:4-hydroxybenzoate polyprenyltransferase|nr:decaprenyl-phosphate phosphoribosyltransferase [Dysgonamonadaceae bacterium]
MKHHIQLLRPKQWVKNLFVFLPLFFSGQLADFSLLAVTFAVFVAWSLMASAIYCFNDICDVESDRLHPEKCRRPLASGALSVTKAYCLTACCILLSLLILTVADAGAWTVFIVVLYLILNVAYSVRLKHVTLIDVFIVSIGFVFRIAAGGLAAGIWISHWIVVMTFLLALFLAFAKRRDDLVVFNKTGVISRRSITGYNMEFLNAALIIASTVTIVAYIMYSVSEDVILRFNNNYVYTSAVFVILGVLRYMQLAFVSGEGGNPVKILWEDRFIQLCIAGWVVVFFVIVYR